MVDLMPTYNGLVHMPTFLQAQVIKSGDVVHTAEDNINTNIQSVLSYATTLGTGNGDFNLNTQLGFSRFDQAQNRQVGGQGLSVKLQLQTRTYNRNYSN